VLFANSSVGREQG